MFGFTKVEREVYNSTFIRKVFVKIQFPALKQLKDKSENIKELFLADFPRITIGKNQGFEILISGNSSNPNFKTIDENDAITLKSEDGQTELQLNCDSLAFTIEGKAYVSFEKNIETLLTKIEKLFSIIGVEQVLTSELRKINIIEFGFGNDNFPNGILDALLNKAVVYNDDAFPEMDRISQNIHNVEFKDGNYTLDLRYGMNTLPIPDKKIGQLIVDYKIQSNVQQNSNLITDEIKLLNDELFNVFSWIFNENSKQVLKNGINK